MFRDLLRFCVFLILSPRVCILTWTKCKWITERKSESQTRNTLKRYAMCVADTRCTLKMRALHHFYAFVHNFWMLDVLFFLLLVNFRWILFFSYSILDIPRCVSACLFFIIFFSSFTILYADVNVINLCEWTFWLRLHLCLFRCTQIFFDIVHIVRLIQLHDLVTNFEIWHQGQCAHNHHNRCLPSYLAAKVKPANLLKL